MGKHFSYTWTRQRRQFIQHSHCKTLLQEKDLPKALKMSTLVYSISQAPISWPLFSVQKTNKQKQFSQLTSSPEKNILKGWKHVHCVHGFWLHTFHWFSLWTMCSETQRLMNISLYMKHNIMITILSSSTELISSQQLSFRKLRLIIMEENGLWRIHIVRTCWLSILFSLFRNVQVYWLISTKRLQSWSLIAADNVLECKIIFTLIDWLVKLLKA